MFTVLANMEVLYKGIRLSSEGFNAIPERIEFIFVKGAIDIAPLDCILGGSLSDDEAIRGGSARATTRFNTQSARIGEYTLATYKCHLDEFGMA
jgi:hypothetical protein